MLELKNIFKTYERKKKKPVKALRGISLSFGRTGFNFIVGRSGGGKTTLLNILAGIDSPTSGEVVFFGKSLSSFKREDFEGYRNEIVGTVFQEYYLIPYYSVGENVKIALDLKYGKMSEDEKKRKVDEYLRKVGLIDEDGDTLYDRDIAELSGGQKQRVAIARAMIKKPKLLLCDEPTGALDERTGKEIFELLREISKECLVIVVTHDESFAREYGDRLIRIDTGQVKEDSGNDCEKNTEQCDVKFPSGKLSFIQCLKIGSRVLLHKRIGLTLSIVGVAVALIITGASIMNITLDHSMARLRQAYGEKASYVVLQGVREYYDEEINRCAAVTRNFDENERQKLEKCGAMPIGNVGLSVENTVPIDEIELYEKTNEIKAEHFAVGYALQSDIDRCLEVNEKTGLVPDGRFKNKALCRLPETPADAAISDIVYELYEYCGFKDSDGVVYNIFTPDDLVGLKLSVSINGKAREVTICGVFETPDSARIRGQSAERETYENYSARVAGSYLASFIYVCPGTVEPSSEDNNYLIRYYLPLTRSYRATKKIIEELSYKDGENRYYSEVHCAYNDVAGDWESFLTEYGHTPFIVGSAVFGLFAVMMSLGYLLGSINARKKEFGILLSLGASRGTVWLIFFIECMAISLIEFVASYLGMWIFCAAFNTAFFHTVYFVAGLLPFALIFAGSIVFTGIAALLALLPLGKVSPKDIVSRAG